MAALNVCKPLYRRLALVSVPKVGLEPTPSCEDRILSPVRLPYTWYWNHVALTSNIPCFQGGYDAAPSYPHCGGIGLILPVLLPICCQIGLRISNFSWVRGILPGDAHAIVPGRFFWRV